MAIVVDSSGFISVGGVDLSDHATKITVNDGQETRDVTVMGKTYHVFRTGLGTPSIQAEFFADDASGSVTSTLRALVGLNSTGGTVIAKRFNSATTAINPSYTMEAIIDGDLNVTDTAPGEVPKVTVKFVPYSTFTVSTSAS